MRRISLRSLTPEPQLSDDGGALEESSKRHHMKVQDAHKRMQQVDSFLEAKPIEPFLRQTRRRSSVGMRSTTSLNSSGFSSGSRPSVTTDMGTVGAGDSSLGTGVSGAAVTARMQLKLRGRTRRARAAARLRGLMDSSSSSGGGTLSSATSVRTGYSDASLLAGHVIGGERTHSPFVYADASTYQCLTYGYMTTPSRFQNLLSAVASRRVNWRFAAHRGIQAVGAAAERDQMTEAPTAVQRLRGAAMDRRSHHLHIYVTLRAQQERENERTALDFMLDAYEVNRRYSDLRMLFSGCHIDRMSIDLAFWQIVDLRQRRRRANTNRRMRDALARLTLGDDDGDHDRRAAGAGRQQPASSRKSAVSARRQHKRSRDQHHSGSASSTEEDEGDDEDKDEDENVDDRHDACKAIKIVHEPTARVDDNEDEDDGDDDVIVKHGGNHSTVINPSTGRLSVPRRRSLLSDLRYKLLCQRGAPLALESCSERRPPSSVGLSFDLDSDEELELDDARLRQWQASRVKRGD